MLIFPFRLKFELISIRESHRSTIQSASAKIKKLFRSTLISFYVLRLLFDGSAVPTHVCLCACVCRMGVCVRVYARTNDGIVFWCLYLISLVTHTVCVCVVDLYAFAHLTNVLSSCREMTDPYWRTLNRTDNFWLAVGGRWPIGSVSTTIRYTHTRHVCVCRLPIDREINEFVSIIIYDCYKLWISTFLCVTEQSAMSSVSVAVGMPVSVSVFLCGMAYTTKNVVKD